MPYVAGDLSVVITGALAGAEVWSNTWAFKSAEVSPDPQDAVDIVHQFYVDLATDLPNLGNEWTAVDATARLLAVPLEVPVTFESIAGTNANGLLPTECAIRLSMTGIDGAKGGCFLAGFTTSSTEDDGTLLPGYKADIASALTTMAASLTASDWTLGIRRPTVPEVEEVLTVRVGEVFDVIRRRRNDLPENYTSVTFA